MRCMEWRELAQLVTMVGMLILPQSTAVSQVDTSRTMTYAHSTIYLGLFGNAFGYSLNYDRRWRSGSAGMSTSTGIFYFTPDDAFPMKHGYSIPIEVNRFHGKDGLFEYGLGLTFSHGLDASNVAQVYSETLHAVLKPCAFRWQRDRGGFFMRVKGLVMMRLVEFQDAWEGYIESHPSDSRNQVQPWFGFDIGYTFKKQGS